MKAEFCTSIVGIIEAKINKNIKEYLTTGKSLTFQISKNSQLLNWKSIWWKFTLVVYLNFITFQFQFSLTMGRLAKIYDDQEVNEISFIFQAGVILPKMSVVVVMHKRDLPYPNKAIF